VLPATPAALDPVTLAEPCGGVADAPTVTVPLSLVPTGGVVTDGKSPVTDGGGVVTVTGFGRLGWLGAAGAAGRVGSVTAGWVVGVGVDGAGDGAVTVGETVMVPDAPVEPADALTDVATFPAGVAPTPEADADGASPAAGVATVVGTAGGLDDPGGAAMPTSGQACALP